MVSRSVEGQGVLVFRHQGKLQSSRTIVPPASLPMTTVHLSAFFASKSCRNCCLVCFRKSERPGNDEAMVDSLMGGVQVGERVTRSICPVKYNRQPV